MRVTERMQARGWNNQIITAAKVVAALMVIGGFVLGGLSLFSVTVAIPTRVSALEDNVSGLSQSVSVLGGYVRFQVMTECARLTAEVKLIMRNSGGVDCDSDDLRIQRPLPAVKIPP